ncbi:spermidine/putrescine ABC transporter substrate-binding protein [Glaciibacter psychrotolerans]|uniref:Spermidine/putrescine ABC transporter substrate-binding protein n=1 Tax=Glaciibacter psychrotolerans TaxID=670054 RepID=A0A7Z0J849_9MICO|nr:spermidine/putrescine ABC transporter substrate-binding protein [Leifsonia psychrotolerans]NYJ21544.1 hypothetical protein [Leifsonia psychrotolerans]
MDGSIEARVDHEVDTWLRWLPRWRPGTHRGRSRLCRQCFGSPIMATAGLATDVPHAVQHALAMRMKALIDAAVDEYTALNLPLLSRELRRNDERRRSTTYRPTEGLDLEYRGLDLDPLPTDDSPYLFTFGELAEATDDDEPFPEDTEPLRPLPPTPLSTEEKAALRVELRLADDFADALGQRICVRLGEQRERIRAGIAAHVEPQVQALLADLDSALDSPLWPR